MTSTDRRIVVEEVAMLYRLGVRAIPFNAVNAFILLVVLSPIMPMQALLAWWLLIAVVSGLRYFHVRSMLKTADFSSNSSRLSSWFLTGVAVTGLLWGGGFLVFAPNLPPVYQSFTLLVMGGMAAGAVTSLGTHRLAYLLFLFPTLLPAAGWCFVQLDSLHVSMGFLIIVVTFWLVLMHASSFEKLRENIKLRLDKDDLVESLENANSELSKLNSALETTRLRLLKASLTDELTGLANRRHLDATLETEWRRCARAQVPLSCILLDVDFFKDYNDRHGHVRGDICLKQIANVLQQATKRAGDLPARYGGEEFMVLLPDTPALGAMSVAERIRVEVHGRGIAHGRSDVDSVVTVSLGVASVIPQHDHPARQLVEAADVSLYEAKRSGRNRSICSDMMALSEGKHYRRAAD